ncbi:MAG: tetratricopeptide repeat protein [Elusimicrobiota bacterium]|jgi:tetratricopeptide (TPR) repeat protein
MKMIDKTTALAGAAALALALVLGWMSLASRSRTRRWERASQASLELYEKGRFSEALLPAEEALKIAERRFGGSDIRTLLSMELAGKLLARTGGLTRSRALLSAAAQASKEVFGEGSSRRARFLSTLAEAKAMAGEFDEAEALHQETLTLVQQDHGVISGPTALAFARLGGLYTDWGLYEQAVPVFNRASAILVRTGKPDSVVSAFIDSELCRILVETGRMQAARGTCPSSLASRQSLLPADHPDLARSLTGMGLYHLRSGRPDKARAHLSAAQELYEKAPAADFRGRESVLLAMAELKAGLGDLPGAQADFGKARSDSDSPYVTVKTLIREAGCELRAGQARLAAGALREALSLHDELPLADKLDRELILFGLGESNAAQGDFDQAEDYLAQALEAAEERHGNGIEDTIAALSALGKVQVSAKRYGRASSTARKLTELGDSYGKDSPYRKKARESAAEIRRAMGRRAG